MNNSIAYSQEKQRSHSHNDSHQDVNIESAIAKKLKSVQLIFDADSVKGFNEAAALSQISSSGAPDWEQKIQMSYMKRRYIDTKYNLNKYAFAKGGIPSVQAPCTNLGFEDGTANGWTITEGINVNSLTMAGCCPTGTSRFAVVGPGADPIIQTLNRVPSGGGNFTLRIGDLDQSGGYVVRAKQTFSVTEANALFVYKYLAILEDAGHLCSEQPYFNVTFTDATGNPIACGNYNLISASFDCITGDRNLLSVNGINGLPYLYKPWTTRAFDLTPYIGQNVTVQFTSGDCALGAHSGWGYIDASCGSMTLNLNGVDLPFGQTSTIFCGSVTSNTLCAPEGFTYNWTGPSVTSQTTQCINPTSSGTYSVNIGVIGSPTLCTSSSLLYATLNLIPGQTITIGSVSNPIICPGNSTTITPSGALTYTLNPGGLTGTSFVVSPTVTTTYSITGASSSSCTIVNTATTQISVNPAITIASVSSPSICLGNSSTIIPSGASIYTLNPDGLTGTSFVVSPTITTTYSISGTGSLSCSTVNTLTTQIVINVSPTISIASVSSPTICSGNTTTITPNGASSYTLNPVGLTGTSFTVSPTNTTTYSIVGTNSLSCPSSNTVKTVITVNSTPNLSILSVSSQTICIGGSTVITPTATPIGAASYTLNPGNLTGTSFTVSPNVTTTYSIVGKSLSNCPSSNTIISKITVNSLPFSTASTTGSITCVNNSINLNSTLSGVGITYTWTAPSGSSITGSANTQNTTAQGLGTYTLNLMGPSGCNYSTTIAAIQNTTAPTSVNAGATQTLVCGLPTLTLTGTATPSTSTANWLGGVISPNNFTTTTGSAGVYTLQAVNPLTGCFITSTVAVIQSIGSPVATANPVTNSITCTNTLVPIGVVVTSPDPVTYQWPTVGISGSTTNSTATATLAGVYSVTITNSPGNNCTSIISITVPTNITPVVAGITPTASLTCHTTSLVLNATPGGANFTYNWTGTSPIVSDGNTKNPTINTLGTYSVAITNTVNGCVGYATITVNSNTAIPSTSLSTASLTITCSNLTPNVAINTNASPASYSWTPTIGIVAGTGNTANPSFSLAGTYSVVVTNNINGCSTNVSDNVVTVYQNTIVPSFTLSNLASNNGTLTCTTLSVVVTPTVMPSIANYTWSSTTGTISSQSTVTLTSAGVYTLTVKDPINGCVTSNTNAASTFTVYHNTTVPTVNVFPISSNTIIGCGVNSSVTYSANVTKVDGTPNYSWISSGGAVGSTSSVFSASIAGTYTLLVTNIITGCSTKNIFTVTASALPSLTVVPVTICHLATASLTAYPMSLVSYTWSPGLSSTSGVFVTGSPSVTTNYTVSATDINGCIGSTIATINVVTNLSVTASSSSSVVCLGGSVNLTGLGASSYTWASSGGGMSSTNGNSISVTPVEPSTTYTVIGSSGNCTSLQYSIIINVNPLPNVMISTSNTLLCVGQTASLTATGASSYTWNTTGTTSVIAVSPITTTNYTVTGVDGNGCLNTATITQSVSVCSDIQTIISNETISIYPNPSSGIATIEINTTFNVIIMDVLGKVVYNQILNKGKHIINLSNYANGLYFVKATSNGKVNTTRLIKE